MSIAQATHAIPEKPAERRVWIGYQLRMRRTSLRQIARQLGVSHQAVSNALNSPSSRIEAELARVLEVPVTVLFPERFDETGARIPNVRPDQTTAAMRVIDSKNTCHTQTPSEQAA